MPTPRAADWLTVVACCVLAAVVGVFSFFYLPLRWGAVPVPVSALAAGAAAWWFPRACWRLTGRLWTAVVPAACVLLVELLLVVMPNAYYGLPLRIVLDDWRSLVLLGVTALAGAVSVSLLWADSLAARVRASAAG